MTTDRLDLLNELLSIDAKDAGALGFMARPLVQVTLPHTNPGDIPAYTRTCGNLHLTIQPMIIQDGKRFVSWGIAYGTIPRLVLAWISTEAVKTRAREIQLGDSLSAFMKHLEVIPSSGKGGTVKRFRKQLTSLFASTFTILHDETNQLSEPGRMLNAGFRLSDSHLVLWDPLNPEQPGLFNSVVVLSEKFYEAIVNRPVPIDMRILKDIRKSPLAIDIYTWLTYRMSYLEKPSTIPWDLLAMQFGSDYKEIKTFKFKFIKRLEGVLSLYPANVAARDDGLTILPSKTSIGKIK